MLCLDNTCIALRYQHIVLHYLPNVVQIHPATNTNKHIERGKEKKQGSTQRNIFKRFHLDIIDIVNLKLNAILNFNDNKSLLFIKFAITCGI